MQQLIFVLLTDGEVAPLAGSFSDPVDVNNLYSLNRVIGNTTPATDAYTNVAPYTTNWDIINLKDYTLEVTNEKNCCCKCKDYKEHKNYCVIDEFQLPDVISSQIFSYTYQCVACKEKSRTVEKIDELETMTNPDRREYNKLSLLSLIRCDKLRKIKTENWIPIKQAMLKFQEQVYEDDDYDAEDKPKICRQRLLNNYGNILHIQKHGNRYMCSSERLDEIDFNITEAPKKHDSAWRNDN